MTADTLALFHGIAMVLASWRLAELIVADNFPLLVKVRERFPSILWTCFRCFSVWASAFAVVTFVYFPWGNWPLALSWLALWRKESMFPSVTLRPTLTAGPTVSTTMTAEHATALLYQTVEILKSREPRKVELVPGLPVQPDGDGMVAAPAEVRA